MLFNKQTLERVRDQLRRSNNTVDASLRCDRWIASSILQKSIRRGEVELALRAACTLRAFDRNALWRRLIVIACEDVGGADIDALLETFLAAASSDLRRQYNEAAVLNAVVRRLAEAVKDRSADYLACAAKDHSGLSEIRDSCRTSTLEQRLRFVGDTSQPLARRAVAAWFASGINWRYDQQVRGGDIRALAATYRDLGAGPRGMLRWILMISSRSSSSNLYNGHMFITSHKPLFGCTNTFSEASFNPLDSQTSQVLRYATPLSGLARRCDDLQLITIEWTLRTSSWARVGAAVAPYLRGRRASSYEDLTAASARLRSFAAGG